MKRTIIYFVSSLLLSSALISCRATADQNETTRNDGDNTPISAEAKWARDIASLRLDDGGTNNGRTRTAILEVLYRLTERLETEGVTPDVRGDIEIIRGATERMYSSANSRARGEWRYLSQDFATLESALDNPEQARVALNQLIARLGG
jgi:hypothetical protein